MSAIRRISAIRRRRGPAERPLPDPLSRHADGRHAGFGRRDAEFIAARTARAGMIHDFLAVMDGAGRPGLRRMLGSTVLQLTAQGTEHYWSTVLRDDRGHHREVLVLDDGRHGWADEFNYSDRARCADDEIPPELLRAALDRILADNGLTWSSTRAVTATSAEAAPEARESAGAYRHYREVEYAWMMGIRVLCLFLAVAVVALKVPDAALWVGLLGVGMIVLPMVAVVVANDHHPRRRAR
jgi:Protein of unknown function (DUF3099)